MLLCSSDGSSRETEEKPPFPSHLSTAQREETSYLTTAGQRIGERERVEERERVDGWMVDGNASWAASGQETKAEIKQFNFKSM